MTEIENGTEKNWRNLGCAIVQQAIIDWQAATEWLEKYAETEEDIAVIAGVEELKKGCEKFFRSPDCELYSGIRGEEILRRLNNGERFDVEKSEN